jgi:uncharacterized protein
MLTTKKVDIDLSKSLSEAGTFEGLLSPFGVVDQGMDLVETGAYGKSLREAGNTRPLLWQHEEPIGELELEERPQGLWAKGRILMGLSRAKDVHLLIKNRVVRGLSIGYKAVRHRLDTKTGVRHLMEIKIMEGSIVTFPMAEMAQITAVKNAENDERKICELLDQIKQTITDSSRAFDSMRVQRKRGY